MPFDPFSVAVAASFTAGCALIHALRRHADTITLVLALLACGLATAVVSLLAARSGMVMLPDLMGGSTLVAGT